jgi:hypothetical protein
MEGRHSRSSSRDRRDEVRDWRDRDHHDDHRHGRHRHQDPSRPRDSSWSPPSGHVAPASPDVCDAVETTEAKRERELREKMFQNQEEAERRRLRAMRFGLLTPSAAPASGMAAPPHAAVEAAGEAREEEEEEEEVEQEDNIREEEQDPEMEVEVEDRQ